MRHAFSFHPDVRDAVRRHVYEAWSALSTDGYARESAWVAACAGRLHGRAYEGPHGLVDFQSTIVDAPGRASAESRFGADLAITASISEGGIAIRSAILLQAKLGRLSHLAPAEAARLIDQIRKMQQLTRAPKILEIPTENGDGRPYVLSGILMAEGRPTQALRLEDYFTRRVLPTLDGDTRDGFVDAVQESSLTRVHVRAIRTVPRSGRDQRSLFE
ncbi:MAG TPA: hypothetical protein VEQ60_09705 [Longimicrobium sp.]|nr:hypothetical protein [Longimicrobium sp.]